MSQKQAKKKRRLLKRMTSLFDPYYILPREVLEMKKLPFYKEELIKKIIKEINDNL